MDICRFPDRDETAIFFFSELMLPRIQNEKMDETEFDSDVVSSVKHDLLSTSSIEEFRLRFKDLLERLLRDSSKVGSYSFDLCI